MPDMPGRPEKLLSYLRRQVRSASPSEESDAVLLTRYLEERTEEAFAELIRRHGPLVLRVCRRVLGDVQLAEDAFQATFLVLARRARAIRRRDVLAAWLHGVALRIALKARSRAARQRVCPARELPDPAADPLSQLTAREFLTALDEEVQRLPEVYRLPLLLCGLEGLAVKEAAHRLGWTEGSIKGRLERGRARLHARLATRGWTVAAALGGMELARGSLRASLSGPLLTRTAKAALAFAGRTPGPGLSAEVLRLAQFGAGGSIAMKLKLGALLVFLASVAALSAGGLASALDQGKAGQPAGAAAAVPPAANADSPGRVDRFGDPLPEGAFVRLGARRFRHEGVPCSGCLSFTPDGKALVGLTYSGAVLWDAATGKESKRFATRLTGFGTSFDISPDGSTLAVPNGPEDEESKVGLWSLRSGKTSGSLTLPANAGRFLIIRRVRFAPDGKTLALVANPQSNGNQGKVVLFDLASRQVQTSLGEGESGYHDLAFSLDGKTLAIAASSPRDRLEFWDTSSWKLIQVTPLQKAYVTSLTFSPDGKILALGTDRVVLVDPATGKELRRLTLVPLPGAQISELRFTADGERLVGGHPGGPVVVWQVASGKVLQNIQERRDLFALALSPDGKTVAVANAWTRTLRLWDLATGKVLFPEYQGHDFGIYSLAMPPDSRKPITATATGPDQDIVTMSSDGKALLTAGGTGEVELWDRTSGRPLRKLTGEGRILTFSPDGTKLAAVAANRTTMTSRVRVWDFVSGKEIALINVPDTREVEMAVFCPDGKMLATLDRDQKQNGFRVRHWNLATGKQERLWNVPLQSYERFSSAVYGNGVTLLPAALARDGRTVVAGSGKSAQAFDAAFGRKRLLASSGEGDIRFLASPDGRFVATWMLNGHSLPRGETLTIHVRQPNSPIRIVEVLTGKEVAVLKRKHDCVAVVGWSAAGRFLATGDNRLDSHLATDGQTVRLWDTAGGKELASFTGFKADVTALALAPDDRQLFAALGDGTVLGWDVARATRQARIVQQLSKNQLETCWTDLGGENADRAYQARWQLLSAPKEAVRLLASRLRPALAADAGKLQQWIGEVGSERFAVRQTAMTELKNLGEQAKGTIEQALKGNPSLEARRRLEQILDHLSSAVPGPATVQAVRAVIILEEIGSVEARRVLQMLAKGASGARETLEARDALERLASGGLPPS
jgi:RNA polymerase sigma factor (sigma-70 family)